MIDRVEIRQVTVPPQTTQAQPFTQDISFDAGQVQAVEIVIPDGHAGITGLALGQGSGAITIPYSGTDWIVSNDEVVRFDYVDDLRTGSWQAYGYNQDFVNPHSFYIRFFVADGPAQPASAPQPLPATAISEAVGAQPLPLPPGPPTAAPAATLSAAADLSGQQAGELVTQAGEPAVSSTAAEAQQLLGPIGSEEGQAQAQVAGPRTASGEFVTTTGQPAVSTAVAESQTLLGPVGNAGELAAEQTLTADAGLTLQVPAGGQGDVPDLAHVEFAVAPPDYGEKSP